MTNEFIHSQLTCVNLDAKWNGVLSTHSVSEDLQHRMRRSLSWLCRAEEIMRDDDPDTAFILYWIAFNALYGTTEFTDADYKESRRHKEFFKNILNLDNTNRKIHEIIRDSSISQAIENLVALKYVFDLFWKYYNGAGYHNWKDEFDAQIEEVRTAYRRKEDEPILRILFSRLYVLRNQLIHGSATWKGEVNRPQVSYGISIVAYLVPAFIDLVIDNPDDDWGTLSYITFWHPDP